MKKIIVLLILLLTIGTTYGQHNVNRHSVYAGVGGNMFMGDLGGGSKDAAHFLGMRDIDLASFRPSACLGYSYKVYDNLSVRATFLYSRAYGDDAETQRETRENRNLNFRSNLLSFGAALDYYFVKEKELPRYAVVSFAKRISAYFTVGFSALKFNPQGEYEGKWYDLQPLCTEGEGTNITYTKTVSGQPPITFTTLSAPYKLLACEIPVGIGMKVAVNRKISVGCEIAYHVTSTDYIDDCSTNYFNWSQYGLTAPSEMTDLLACKMLNSDGSQKSVPNTGATRGDSGYDDAYLTLMFTCHYKIISAYGKHRR